MASPRPSLSATKLRRTRLLLAAATVVLVAGMGVDAASDHGLWTTGLIGWAAILVAVGLGAGRDNVADIVGLGAHAERWRRGPNDEAGRGRPVEAPRNDADWS